jgi:hypothetical protein
MFDHLLDLSLQWMYRWTSFYGESWPWAIFVLMIIVLGVFPVIYRSLEFMCCPQDVVITHQVTDCGIRYLNWSEAFQESLAVATLQRIDHRKPIDESANWYINAETIAAPLQFALLALAIRRKFMR